MSLEKCVLTPQQQLMQMYFNSVAVLLNYQHCYSRFEPDIRPDFRISRVEDEGSAWQECAV